MGLFTAEDAPFPGNEGLNCFGVGDIEMFPGHSFRREGVAG